MSSKTLYNGMLHSQPRLATLKDGHIYCSNCFCVKLTGIVFILGYLR